MAEFFAHRYAVGGAWTYGGDIETDYDDQPAGLTQVWDGDRDEWREIQCAEHGVCWVPYVDGEPMPDGTHCTWHELLGDFGPVWDGVPEDISADLAWAVW